MARAALPRPFQEAGYMAATVSLHFKQPCITAGSIYDGYVWDQNKGALVILSRRGEGSRAHILRATSGDPSRPIPSRKFGASSSADSGPALSRAAGEAA